MKSCNLFQVKYIIMGIEDFRIKLHRICYILIPKSEYSFPSLVKECRVTLL